MGEFVIAAYRPKEGSEARLLEIVREHVPLLRREGLATDRPAYVMRARDGAILEIFEWASREAIDRAHASAAVQEIWTRFEQVCEFEALANLEECRSPFAPFTPLDL